MNVLDLTIVVLAYNQEKYIEQTLKSILEQEHPYSFEIIIGEDHSKDGTRMIIRALQEQYPEVIKPVFNEKNLGLIQNYFNVVKKAKGRYIMLCGGDDYWLPGKIARQLGFMGSHVDVGMCYGVALMQYEREDGRGDRSLFIARKCETFKELLKGNSICASTSCFRKELLDTYIERVKPTDHRWEMEDYPFWLWISQNSKIKFLDDVVAVYRVRDGSISHDVDLEKRIGFENSSYDVKRYFVDHSRMRKRIYSKYISDLSNLYYSDGDIKKAKLILKASGCLECWIKSIFIGSRFYARSKEYKAMIKNFFLRKYLK